MKKIYVLIISLLMLSVSAFAFIDISVYEEKDKVEFLEKTIYGDKAAADGLEIVVNNHLKYHFFWETTYHLDGKDVTNCETEYSFSAVEKNRSLYNYKDFELDDNRVYRFDEGFVVFSDEEITFSSYDNGTNIFKFTVDLNNDIEDKFFKIYSDSEMVFDGEKLAIIGVSNFGKGLGSFNLVIYDKSGMLYWGEYQSSLLSEDIALDYHYNRIRDDKSPYEIRWK